jgi:putative endonuclease
VRQYYVYILASRSRRLYVGVTSNLLRRLAQHRAGLSAFTTRYRILRLVYFESCGNAYSAITREKQIKSWRRSRRVALIESANRPWDDLSEPWFEGLVSQADPSSPRR